MRASVLIKVAVLSKATDEALFVSFKHASAMNAPIDRSILMMKADELAKKIGENDYCNRWLVD